MMFSARVIGAAEALRLGLTDTVAAFEQLEEQARELASAIAAHAPSPISWVKRMIGEAQHMELRDALAHERENYPGWGEDFTKQVGQSKW